MIDYKIIGSRIRQYRQNRGITQEDLAFQINTSAAYISNIERGIKKPSLQKLTEIAEANIYIWVNPETVSIAICACQRTNKDALKVPTGRNCEFCSSMLFEELRKTKLVKFKDCTYRLSGTVNQSKRVAEFDVITNLNTIRRKQRQANV